MGGGVEGGGGVEAEDLERRGARIQYLPRLSLEAPTERRDARTAEGRAAPRRRRRWQCPRAAERGRVAARRERRCDGGHHRIAVASDRQRLPQFRRSRGCVCLCGDRRPSLPAPTAWPRERQRGACGGAGHHFLLSVTPQSQFTIHKC